MNKQRKGSYKYSFLNPEDEEEMLMEWGGRSFVRENYPSVWAAIQRTKEYEYEVQKNACQRVEGYVYTGYPNLVSNHDTGKKRLSALLTVRLEDGTYIPNGCSVNDGVPPASRAWPYAMLSGNIRNLTDSHNVASYGKAFYNLNDEIVELTSDAVYDGTDFTKKRVETFCSYAGVDFNDVLHKEQQCRVNPDYSDEGGSSIVRQFIVKAPYSQYRNNPIKILYDRVPFDSEKGSIDYSYTNVKVNNMVKTCIPMAAELHFTDDIVPAVTDPDGKPMDILNKEQFYRPQLFFGDPLKARVKFNRDFDAVKSCLKRNGSNLLIDFSKLDMTYKDYWNEDMSVNNYTTGATETGRTVELHADFYINLVNTRYHIYTVTGISIVSVPQDKLPAGYQYYLTNDGMTAYIPPINIRWGCFARETRITMGNGDKKPVERISSGDVLFTTTGTSKVKTVYAGREQKLLCICTEGGRSLKVTHSHPVVLACGNTVPAREIHPGYDIMTGNGGSDKVRWIYEEDYNDIVYNFEFTDGKEHVVEANGILAGEFISQNSCKSSIVRRQHITPQTQSLVEQFSAMQMNVTSL